MFIRRRVPACHSCCAGDRVTCYSPPSKCCIHQRTPFEFFFGVSKFSNISDKYTGTFLAASHFVQFCLTTDVNTPALWSVLRGGQVQGAREMFMYYSRQGRAPVFPKPWRKKPLSRHRRCCILVCRVSTPIRVYTHIQVYNVFDRCEVHVTRTGRLGGASRVMNKRESGACV